MRDQLRNDFKVLIKVIEVSTRMRFWQAAPSAIGRIVSYWCALLQLVILYHISALCPRSTDCSSIIIIPNLCSQLQDL